MSKKNRAIESYTFTIEGQPVPKGRPRFGRGRTYTPVKTAAAEQAIAWAVKKQIKKPLEGDITMICWFFVKGKKHGDLSNLIKLVEDGCNGVAFLDDKQIIHLEAEICYPVYTRGYTSKPRTIFSIQEFEEGK